MFIQSKKVQEWKRKDYVRTILQFVLHTVIIVALMVGLIFINENADVNSFLNYLSNSTNLSNFICLILMTSFIIFTIYMYFYSEARDFLLSVKNIVLLFVVIEVSFVATILTGKYFGLYARPVAFCAILILLLINKRTAIFTSFIFSLLIFITDIFTNQAISVEKATMSLVLSYVTSIMAIFFVDGYPSRIKVIFRGLLIAIPIIVCAICFEFSSIKSFHDVASYVIQGFVGGILSVVYMMAILPIFEWAFNALTNYRLVEITDHKSKMIKKLNKEANGTFSHSTALAVLAEACAAAIDENPILARACAYYHDIGKLKQPIYFTENQTDFSPHDDLTPELSTEIIRSHTKDGYDIIKMYHLPLILADVAMEHHGTMPIKFFYAKALKFTDGEVDIKDYSYYGPKPSSKIAAIIMIADSSEAAVRSMKDRSRQNIEKVVRELIEERMKYDQFSDCDITMDEIDIIRATIVDSLSGTHHKRIKYPIIRAQDKNFFATKDY